MRKLMMAVGAVAALAMASGCSKRDNVAEQRQDVAEAQSEAQQKTAEIRQEERQDIARTQQDAREDIAETRGEANQEVANAQQDVREEQSDLAKAERERGEDLAQGGSGTTGATAAATNVQGRVLDTGRDTLTLVDTVSNRQIKLKTNDQSRILHDNHPVKLGDIKEGDQVRASYVADGKDLVVRELSITQPATPAPK
ncbi:hypothetical protein [Myxococcus landrumensis]|uniref:Lipoprotein n=1 Tax=Myxococcus landrumensis TaxID=2813577 RepID=A0ABX7N8P2_9BACT|nr:hypothetical protein [Myxococcus landrumus]QSQ15140.1 hypothetical protein JY572_03375 [Myxococcus landrumus]